MAYFSTKSMSEIDVTLFVFLERYASSLIKWDILTYFGNHPDSITTALELSCNLNKNYQVVRRNVGDLALLGILDMDNSDTLPGYRLAKKPNVQSLVRRMANNPPKSPF